MQDNHTVKSLCLYYDHALIDTDYEPFINIQCGRSLTGNTLDMLGDDTGDNISERNPFWSEITGLYWAWKNLPKQDFIGLASYRRYFNFNFNTNDPVQLASAEEAPRILQSTLKNYHSSLFDDADVITPIPYTYAYSIRKVCSMNYNDSDFDKLEKIIREQHPAYMDAYTEHMYHNNKMIGHNMFIMSWENFQNFCSWVFAVLFEVERCTKPHDYPKNQIRIYGYMHELLLEVFILKNNLRAKRSQLLWVNDAKKCHFNSKLYRSSARVFYGLSKMRGEKYSHLVRKTA
jgi:hypothetical protein